MGLDPFTLGMIGMGVVSVSASVAGDIAAKERSEKQAEALKLENEIRTKEKARQVKKMAGQQRASFLSSGISLTGEGTAQDVIGETYQFGQEDIDLMSRNTQTQMENVLSRGRTEFLGGLGKGAMGLASTFLPFAEFGTGSGAMNPLGVKGGQLYTGGAVKTGDYSLFSGF
jgi:hypothetical protein